MKAVAVGVAIAIVVACAAAPKQGTAPVAPSAHDRIEDLSNEIATAKAQLGLGAEAPRVEAFSTPTCVRSERDTCKQTCRLSDSICGDANKICDLADTMPGDAWATDKCDSARATCADAAKKCCACA